MLTVSFVAFGLIGIGFVLLIPVLVRLSQRCSAADIDAVWLANFSPATYRPMHGLLAREDFQFLARQPGFDLSLYRKLRRERMIIFRQYLVRLISDFNRLDTCVRVRIAYSETDQSELLARLAILKFQFTMSVLRAQTSYYLCMIGIGSLATHAVVAHLEEISSYLIMDGSNARRPLSA